MRETVPPKPGRGFPHLLQIFLAGVIKKGYESARGREVTPSDITGGIMKTHRQYFSGLGNCNEIATFQKDSLQNTWYELKK